MHDSTDQREPPLPPPPSPQSAANQIAASIVFVCFSAAPPGAGSNLYVFVWGLVVVRGTCASGTRQVALKPRLEDTPSCTYVASVVAAALQPRHSSSSGGPPYFRMLSSERSATSTASPMPSATDGYALCHRWLGATKPHLRHKNNFLFFPSGVRSDKNWSVGSFRSLPCGMSHSPVSYNFVNCVIRASCAS